MGRDSAAAVHEAAATLGFTLKKEQEKVIVAFTQGHDVFVVLPTGFGNSLCCRTFLTNFEVSLENMERDSACTPTRLERITFHGDVYGLLFP